MAMTNVFMVSSTKFKNSNNLALLVYPLISLNYLKMEIVKLMLAVGTILV